MLHHNIRWALFRSHDGKLYKITEGMRVGLQQALLTHITDNQVEFKIDADAKQGEKPKRIIMPLEEPKT